MKDFESPTEENDIPKINGETCTADVATSTFIKTLETASQVIVELKHVAVQTEEQKELTETCVQTEEEKLVSFFLVIVARE